MFPALEVGVHDARVVCRLQPFSELHDERESIVARQRSRANP
jgi:hypothetical protein